MSRFLISEAVLSCFFMVGWYKRYRLWLTNNFPEQLEISTSPSVLCIQLVDHSPCHRLEDSQPAEPFTDLSRDVFPSSQHLNGMSFEAVSGIISTSFGALCPRLRWSSTTTLTNDVDRFHVQQSVKYTVALQWLYRFSLLIFWLSVLHVPLKPTVNTWTEGVAGACTIWELPKQYQSMHGVHCWKNI